MMRLTLTSEGLRRCLFGGALVGALALGAGAARADSVSLSSLDLSKASHQGQVAPQADKTVDGKAISINKKTFEKGVSVEGNMVLFVNLGGGSDRFTATLGIDDESSVSLPAGGRGFGAGFGGGARRGNAATSGTAARGGRGGARGARGGRGGGAPVRSASLRILGDGRVLLEATQTTLGNAPVPISVNTKGVKEIAIIVAAAGGGRGGRGGFGGAPHVDLADASFDVTGAKPHTDPLPEEKMETLTPPPGPAPRINGPVLTGVTPGHPVEYKIPATGTKPIAYSVDKLPEGLKVDAATGIITGTIKDKGTYTVTLHARNSVGSASKEFKFVADGTLELTPALGWNSWNVFRQGVSDADIRATADAMVEKGLIDHGWTYVNIDDGWEHRPGTEALVNPTPTPAEGAAAAGGGAADGAAGGRGRGGRGGGRGRGGQAVFNGPTRTPDGVIIPNSKFPDMKALGDYIHEKGLKFGIYSGPGPTTCQGLEASWQHEQQDVDTWVKWGVDYIKYDWCSYSSVLSEEDSAAMRNTANPSPEGLVVLKKPYQVLRAALDKAPRDVVYSLCQYGWGQVWNWGAEPDIRGNSWRTTGDISDNWQSMSTNGFNRDPQGNPRDFSAFAGPGHWNDPDMLEVGVVTGGPNGTRPTNLTPNEQYVHITLWTLYASPMLLGCDLSKLDDFTLGLLTNDEVLAVHQDPLGKAGKRVSHDGQTEVWARPLADGSQAVALFNLDEMAMKVSIKWSELGITGKQTVRDLWRQKDLGAMSDEFTTEVPRHGCVLVKISPAGTRTEP